MRNKTLGWLVFAAINLAIASPARAPMNPYLMFGPFDYCAAVISPGTDAKISDEILSIRISEISQHKVHGEEPKLGAISHLPANFSHLLRQNEEIRKHWNTPDPQGDTSRHDWMLGLYCVRRGIVTQEELLSILSNNPNGEFRREGRIRYLTTTVGKLFRTKFEIGAQ